MLDRLAAATGDVVYATTRSGNEAVGLARRKGAFPIRAVPAGSGMWRPLDVGSGSLSIPANLPDDEAEAIMAENAESYTAASFSAAHGGTALP